MAKTVVGLYDTLEVAQRVVYDLAHSGFSRDNIGVAAYDAEGTYADRLRGEPEPSARVERTATMGTGVGAASDEFKEMVNDLETFHIPGIGPVVAAGPLASTLKRVSGENDRRGITGALVRLSVPEEEAHYYAEGVRRGGTLVLVETSDSRVNQAVEVMERHNVIDIEERSALWRQKGWTGFEPEAEPYTAADVHRDREQYEKRVEGEAETTIPVVEEELRVGKRAAERSRVWIHSYIEEQPVEEEVPLREEKVTVERHSVDRPATEADLETPAEETIEVRETAEEPIVSKRARVVEEVDVHKDIEEHTEKVRDTIRRTEVEVEQGTKRSIDIRGFEIYDADFRQYHTSTFGGSGIAYEEYAPAYQYGYTLGTDARYRGRDWPELEAEARQDWEAQHPGTWEQYQDAVRYSWDKCRTRS